jgi:alpha-N-arabinofuranosidase
MANLAQMVNVIAPIMTNETGLFLQPIYFPIAEYGRQRGNVSLDAWVSSPVYQIQNRGPELQYLDVSATRNPDTGEIFVNVLNRSETRDITSTVETSGRPDAGSSATRQVDVWQMNHPDLKATHTFGNDEVVRPVTRRAGVTLANGAFAWTFPAHSLTILRFEMP